MTNFILGAGFNADTTVEAGPLFTPSLCGTYQIDCSYPLVGDAIRLCFGLQELPYGKSVEDLFSEALKRGEYDPIDKLADRLRYADLRIATALARDEKLNCYRSFFETFTDSNFLTFNYDSLPETFLFKLGRWYPYDGYGVCVVADLPPGAARFKDKRSPALVLHLHGSLCIRTSEYEMRRQPEDATPLLVERALPKFEFDPYSVPNFAPFDREVGDDDVKSRIIAPVPNKAQGLKGAFIRNTYTKAIEIVRASDVTIAIGYSFNKHDRGSYQPLLHAMCESQTRRLLVVAPDAGQVVKALRRQFPDLQIKRVDATFKQWAESSFPGADSGN